MAKQLLDQYYTKPEDVANAVATIDDIYGIDSFDAIVEPSAGMGAFLEYLPDSTIALDIDPKHDSVVKQDFFTYKCSTKGRVLTVGNPPFGRRAKTAKDFINHASKYSEVIAFILPSIFMKPGFTNTIAPYFHLVHTTKNIDSFLLPDGKVHKVNCCFQIWEKRSSKREKVVLPNTHPDFTMVHAHLSRTSPEQLEKLRESDFCIGQVSGRIQNVEDVSTGSQYFVTDNTPDKTVREVFERSKLTQPEVYNMGAVSFARADVVRIYTERTKG